MMMLTLLASLFLGASPAAQESSTLRGYDLGELVPLFDQDWTQPLFVAPAEADQTTRAEAPRTEQVAPEVVVEILSQLLGEEFRQQGRSIALEGESRLLVLAPEAVHARLARLLDGLRGAFQSELEVRVDVLSLQGVESLPAPPTNVLSEEAAGRLRADLVARGAALESRVLRLQAGRTAHASVEHRVPFLGDWDVEIAQGSFIFDPVVREAREGLRLTMRGVSVPGGTLLTTVVCASELEGEPLSHEVDLEGLLTSEKDGARLIGGKGVLQTVRVGVGGAAFQAFLPEGKVLLASMHSSTGPKPVQRIVLISKQGGAIPAVVSVPFEGTSRTVVLVNGERIRPPALSVKRGEVEEYYGDEHPLLAASCDTQFPLFLRDWVRDRFGVWRVVGPWLAVVSDPAWDHGPGELEALVKGYALTASDRDVALEVRGQGQRSLCGFRLPLLEGSEAAVLVGTTATFVLDRSVEVAQLSAVPDPVVLPLFEGLAGTFAARRSSAGATSLAVRGSARFFEGEPSALQLGGLTGGELTLVPRRFSRFDELVATDEEGGRPTRATIGEGSSLALELELR